VTSSLYIKAIAVKSGLTNSAIIAMNFIISSVALPSGWSGIDIGTMTPSGFRAYDATTHIFTNTGAGADIESTADACSFIYKQVTGDITITAQVSSITNTNTWAKGGVMIRETLQPNASNAMTTMTTENGVSFQRRTSTGGGTTGTVVSGVNLPGWVRLKRSGNTFTGYYSTDGINWNTIGSATITMASTVYVGIPVTSHNDGTSATAIFSDVTVQ